MPHEAASRGGSATPPNPWAAFLEALDGSLHEVVEVHCVGGFAVTMQFGLSRATSDIDVLTASPSLPFATGSVPDGPTGERLGRARPRPLA